MAAARAADLAEWDEREREQMGWPSEEEEDEELREANAGGTQVELVSVIAGPPEPAGGYRLVLVQRFGDGITFHLDRLDVPEREWEFWELTDDRETDYHPSGGGGGNDEEEVDFRTAPPPDATWVQLTLQEDPAATFRVAL